MLLFFMPLGDGFSVGGSRELEAQESGRITLGECAVLSLPMPLGSFSPLLLSLQLIEGKCHLCRCISRLAVPPSPGSVDRPSLSLGPFPLELAGNPISQ